MHVRSIATIFVHHLKLNNFLKMELKDSSLSREDNRTDQLTGRCVRQIFKESQSVGICNETTNNTFRGFMSAAGVLHADNFIKIDYPCYELETVKNGENRNFSPLSAYNSNESKDSYIFRCLLLLSVF